MGGCVGFIQNLMGPGGKRCVDGAGVDVEEDCGGGSGRGLAAWPAAAWKGFNRPSAVLFPRLLGGLGAGLQPRWVRGWSLLLAEGSARQEWASTLRRCVCVCVCCVSPCQLLPSLHGERLTTWLLSYSATEPPGLAARENPSPPRCKHPIAQDLSTHHPPSNLKLYRNSIFPGPGAVASLTAWSIDA